MDDTAPIASVTDELLAQSAWARGLARRLVAGEARRDDVLQQAWLAVLKRRRDAIRTSARGWFGGVLRHVAAKQRREAARRDARERAAALPEAQPATADHVAELEAQRLVVDALLRIEEPYRETLVRRWYRDEKPAAIARAMGIPVKTADTRLARGLERLRAEIAALRGGVARDGLLALLPLAASAPGPWAVVGSLAGGGLAVGAIAKFAAAAALVAGVAWWGASRGGDEARRPAKGGGDVAANTPSATAQAATGVGEAKREESDTSRTEAAAAAAILLVHVFDDEGRAVAGGTARLFEGDQMLAEGFAFEGLVHIASPREAARLLFIPRGRRSRSSAPACFDVPAHATELELRLPRGAVLSGRIVCDGRPPGCGVVLKFRGKTPLPGLRDLAEAVRGSGSPTDVEVMCDDDGEFRIAGLDPEVGGYLCVDQHFSATPIRRTADGSFHLLDSVGVATPIEGMRLEIFSPPALVGRLVDRNGAPRTWKGIRATFERGGERSESQSAFQGEAGRFRVHLPHAGADGVDLQIEDEDGSAALVHVAGPFVGTRDLGDVVLAPVRSVRFRVVATGEPALVSGSALLIGAGGARHAFDWSAREFDMEVAQPFTRARFAAAGRIPVEVELPARSGEAPVEVVLERATRLDVALERPASQAGLDSVERPDATIEVAARGPLFDPRFGDRELDYRCGGTSCEVDDTLEPGWTVASSNNDAGVTLYGVRAGTPLHVRAVGATGRTITERVVEFAPGETREVVLPLGDEVRTLAARVLDAEGRPIEGAIVHVRSIREDARHGGTGTTTDGDGRVRFDEYFDAEVAVEISASGFVSMRVSPVHLVGEAVVEWRLGRCWSLAVEVVDPEGRAIVPDDVFAVPEAELGAAGPNEFEATRGDDGAYDVKELPPVPVRVRVNVGGRDYFTSVAPPQPRARVVVPVHGHVEVRYTLPLLEREAHGELLRAIELAPRDDRGARVSATAFLFAPQRPTGSVGIPDVLPGRYEAILVWRATRGDELRRESTGVFVDVTADTTSEVVIER